MIDGSRRLTRRNRKYLRMFTPYRPISSEPPAAEYQKTAVTEPGRKRQPAVLPGHVQQEPQRVPDHVHPHQQRAQPRVNEAHQERHGGFVYKPLQDCPRQGTVSDLLVWAVLTAGEGHDEGLGGQVRDDGPGAGGQQQDDVLVRQGQDVQRPRGSTRASTRTL